MEVYVVMQNDYPVAVFGTLEMARDMVDRNNKPDEGIHVRWYCFTLNNPNGFFRTSM